MVDPKGAAEAILAAFMELIRAVSEIVRLVRLLAGG